MKTQHPHDAQRPAERPQSRRGMREGRVRAVWAALGRIPWQLRRPESLLFVMALFASVGAHMPPYLSLGSLVEHFRNVEEAQSASEEMTLEFEVAEQPAADDPPPEEVPPEAPRPEKVQPDPQPRPELAARPVPIPDPAAPPPPRSARRRQSVEQPTDDPDQSPPDDARFVAEQNRRVDEETMARDRSAMQDAAQVRPEKTPEPLGPTDGADRAQEAREALAQRPTPPSPARPPAQGTIVQDPLGSFELVPVKPRSGVGRPGASRPRLSVDWEAFEQTYGEAMLAMERRRRRGNPEADRKRRWEQFRAAVENYIEGVRPGNTTALNAAADPFASYIAAFHRRLHPRFAQDFLHGLPSVGDLADPSLMTKVEIVVNPDGSLHRLGIVRTSGQLVYDLGSFNAVLRGAPYPRPPGRIRSGDGRVYLRWALHRNHSQCGTWNAEAYILPDPPDLPSTLTPREYAPPSRPEPRVPGGPGTRTGSLGPPWPGTLPAQRGG